MPKSVKSEDTRKKLDVLKQAIFGMNKILTFAHVLFVEFIIYISAYNAFAIFVVLRGILQHTIFTGIGIAVDTEMSTRIIYAYIFAYHTTAHFSLPLIFQVLDCRWYYQFGLK